MQEGLFAILSDHVGAALNTLKIVRMKPVCGSPSYSLCAYMPEDHEGFELIISKASDTSPSLETVPLEDGEIYLWRTPYTVSHKGRWLPILDSDERERFPGEFVYVYNSRVKKCMRIVLAQMQLRVMVSTLLLELPDNAPTTVSNTLTDIPRFVLDALKRDAIARQYECPISASILTSETPLSITACYHIFEKKSLDTWLKENPSCPLCKSPVSNTYTV
jgi:hypothetical protein